MLVMSKVSLSFISQPWNTALPKSLGLGLDLGRQGNGERTDVGTEKLRSGGLGSI